MQPLYWSDQKIKPYVQQMQETLAQLLGVSTDDVSVKATTNERMGFIGKEEGVVAYAVALIEKD
jgi:2-C-methyl-D-erythritol 2,4-cyclodiphosphate synthase